VDMLILISIPYVRGIPNSPFL